MRGAMEHLIRSTQDSICNAIAAIDGTRFREDPWERPGGGGGITRILEGGKVLEKAGVNISIVGGALPAPAVAAMRARVPEQVPLDRFYAAGLSLVMHPHNPHAPTVHANFRYFELGDGSAPGSWWFGGGADLTPSILYEEDARHFHASLKRACDVHDRSYYPRFKSWCDEYFFLRHRGEARGIGGIFFDDLNHRPAAELFPFVRSCAQSFNAAYGPILARRKEQPFTEEQKHWQLLRRGRYVEFNLIYDRGTQFGLQTGARVESVLMSLPESARWEYAYEPPPGGEEARLVEVLRRPRDWV